MQKRLFAVLGSGVVLAAILTGSVFARDFTSNPVSTLQDQIRGLPHAYESEDSEGQSVYIDLRNTAGESEADAQ